MRFDRTTQRLRLQGDDGAVLDVGYQNQGDPYREGISLCLDAPDYRPLAYLWLEDREAIELRDLLLTLYPLKA